VQPAIDALVARLPATPKHDPKALPWRDAVTLLPAKDEAYAITTQVNYVAAGCPLFSQGEALDGSLYVVARFLSRGYLWDNVRVVGGAYGGGCALNTNTGALAFSSYRDPNLQATLDIYAKTIDALDALQLSDDALEQAIVGAAGDLDSPLTSQQKGQRALNHYLTGTTTEIRQAFRDQVIGTTRESFAQFAEVLRGKRLYTAVFGSKDALDKANADRSDDVQIEVTPLV